ncbi:hypothetical protein Tco_0033040 [Tanacetum coccineum]
MSTSINISTIPYCSRVLRLGPPRLERDLRCHSITTSTVSNCKQLRIYKEMRYCIIYDAEMELMNLILLSIPNDIYNSVDACTSAKDMWKRDEAGVILTDEQNDFLFADALRMEEIEDLSANICLMDKIQPVDNTSDDGPSYDSVFISEVQSLSNNENEEQMYPTHTKIINSTIGDNQIDSDIIFDSPNRNVNSGSIEKDTHVPDLCALEQLARNAYQEAECDNRDLSSYAFSDSLLLTPLCCDDIHDVTPCVSALAGFRQGCCERLVSEPLVTR